eukprot:snap_masked-scaffold_12-processed-gene-7.20-mRNA-1 protein AED:1.00 eAED:1.00 QI:0/-1/0/0/-1/1/1/0/80
MNAVCTEPVVSSRASHCFPVLSPSLTKLNEYFTPLNLSQKRKVNKNRRRERKVCQVLPDFNDEKMSRGSGYQYVKPATSQ